MRRPLFLAIFFIILLAAGLAAAAPAKPVIKADKTYYDVNAGLYVLKGNVYIEFRNQVITAGLARASLGSMEIWGSGGVTLTYGDIRLAADSVHVISSASKARIDGGVTFSRGGTSVAADRAEFNWGTKLTVFSGNVKVTQIDKAWSAESVTYNVETNTLQ